MFYSISTYMYQIKFSSSSEACMYDYLCSLYNRYSLFIMSLWRYCMNMYCSVSETNVCLLPNFLHMFFKMNLTIYMSKNLSFVTPNWKLSAKGQIISGQNCGVFGILLPIIILTVKKNVLVMKKNFWNWRLKAKNCKKK